jgi:repressor LexA
MKDLTKRQQEVLAFIAGYTKTRNYAPTVREVGAHFSISVKGAYDHVKALKRKGFIRQESKRSRTMEVVKGLGKRASEACVHIPLLGTVAAGKPITAEENWEGSMILPQSLLKEGTEYFGLKIRGDSMENAGIMEGDTAIIDQRDMVKNGEIAVALVDDAATIKTFYLENTRVRLQPENPKYQPIYCQGDVRVLGRLAYIIRAY